MLLLKAQAKFASYYLWATGREQWKQQLVRRCGQKLCLLLPSLTRTSTRYVLTLILLSGVLFRRLLCSFAARFVYISEHPLRSWGPLPRTVYVLC